MSDRGSVLPMFAVIVFGGVMVLGLALDLGRWASTWREAAFAADTGATAGAAMIDNVAAYRGELALDPARAQDTAVTGARDARPRAGRAASAEVTAARVCVTVRQPFRPTLLRAVGVGERMVTATACAVPAQG